jgi:LSD1 subclass zinc finger protein
VTSSGRLVGVALFETIVDEYDRGRPSNPTGVLDALARCHGCGRSMLALGRGSQRVNSLNAAPISMLLIPVRQC